MYMHSHQMNVNIIHVYVRIEIETCNLLISLHVRIQNIYSERNVISVKECVFYNKEIELKLNNLVKIEGGVQLMHIVRIFTS